MGNIEFTPLALAAALIGYITTFGGVVIYLRKLWAKIRSICEGQQCQLRNDITAIYYRHSDEERPTIREYERKNLDDLYEGYKALGGNHYIDDLYNSMREWHVSK